MRIFVSGLPKSGKTTLIKRIYEEFKEKTKISGFFTEEILRNDYRIGFKMFFIDEQKEYLFASKKNEFNSSVSYAGYFLNLRVLEEIVEKIDLNAKLLIIDEIGKMEMLSNKFKNFIQKILKNEINLLATLHRAYIKEFENFGKIYFLSRENWNKVYEEIKNLIIKEINL
ncbi:MAG: nucleoside-triphosphatase [Candidatus Aenigmatarchaeota archaeon]